MCTFLISAYKGLSAFLFAYKMKLSKERKWKMKKLLVFDVDGTLWHPFSGLSFASEQAIKQLAERGYHLCIATGRTTGCIPDPIRNLPIHSWITSDGASIRSLFLQEDHTIDPVQVQNICCKAEMKNWGVSLECEDRLYMNEKACMIYESMNRMKKSDPDIEKIKYENCFEKWDHTKPVFKICLMAPSEEIEPELVKGLDMLAAENLVELHPPGIHKGTALKRLQQSLGISEEYTVCFGDGLNDLAMRPACSCFVAMAEAAGAVQEQADVIATRPMELAIEQTVCDLGLIKKKEWSAAARGQQENIRV